MQGLPDTPGPTTRPTGIFGRLGLLCLAAGLLAAGTPAQAYPERPVSVVVGFAPGGPTDFVARTVFTRVSEILNNPFVIENKPGANSNIGMLTVSRAKPDGHTILYATAATATNPGMYRKPEFEIRPKLEPVMLVASIPYMLLVPPQMNVSSAKELMAVMRATPGKFAYASSGQGNGNHLAMQLLLNQQKIDAVHIPYRGSAPANVDLMAGQVQAMLDTVNTTMPLVRDGKLKALAIASPQRIGIAPDLPTISESLLPGFESGAWHGIWVPAGTPKAVIGQLNAAVAKALAQPDIRAQLESQGVVIYGSSPEEFSKYYDAELARWTSVIDSLGIKAE